MLRYYTYYSVGGYKDLYLGNSEMTEEYTYFLPLLSIMRKEAEESSDEEQKKQVIHAEKLPKILMINRKENHGLPSNAIRFMSHGGYKLVYTMGDNAHTSMLVLRNISRDSKDESGHAIPFLLMIVADTREDIARLEQIAAYWSNHLQSVSKKIASLLGYDAQENGLRFSLKAFNEWIKTCETFATVRTFAGEKAIISRPDWIGILIMSEGLSEAFIRKELQLEQKKGLFIRESWVCPLDDPKRMRHLQATYNAQERLKKAKIIGYTVGGAVLAGLLAYWILSSGDINHG